jgi:sterol desaturase/sphingolipid hydroxylase (fatty acid hydroxylase superfamily)
MEQYGKILLIAMPAFLVLVLLEKWYGIYKGKETVRTMDMISSLSSGVTNVTKDVLELAFVLISYQWLVNRVALTHIHTTWLIYLVVFLVLDFAGYAVHALDHRINFFWNSHIVHHSSEDFNLACALRQSVSVFVKLFVILLIPAALLGIDPKVIAFVAPLHLFAQFWYHTQHINKMGFLEKIIVTPSHHRVHHALNKEYIDKNYGQILIVWDKMFGTFQEELKDVPPVYGITRPVQTWNPIKINFQHMSLMMKDAWRAKNWKDKLRIWFMPTGWRPADIEEKYPVNKIEDAYNFEKYHPITSKLLMVWSCMQLGLLLIMVSYLFGNIAAIGKPNIFIYGGFVFLFVYAYTELMDGSKYAIIWETAKNIVGIGLIIYFGDWFGSNKYFGQMSYLVIGYFILSMIIASIVTYQKKKATPVELSMAA